MLLRTNSHSFSVKGCSFIYAPRGQAGEYAPLAANPYRGCGHKCAYCYVPRVTKQERGAFDAGAELRDTYRAGLLKDAKKYQALGLDGVGGGLHRLALEHESHRAPRGEATGRDDLPAAPYGHGPGRHPARGGHRHHEHDLASGLAAGALDLAGLRLHLDLHFARFTANISPPSRQACQIDPGISLAIFACVEKWHLHRHQSHSSRKMRRPSASITSYCMRQRSWT